VTIHIDPPTWPGHGRLWSHMISDASYDELHDFAARLGIPPRAFERDHYDVIEDPRRRGRSSHCCTRPGSVAARYPG
jgi:hypothetical protein